MTARPKFSTLMALVLVATMAALLALAVALDRGAGPRGATVITVRLWDQQVAAAYRRSFDEFARRHPGIEVRVNVVAYATYFTALRTDVAGGSADDIFWINNAYLAPYADNGRLVDVLGALGPSSAAGWEPGVVEQFTRNGTLWGVPQLTDAGIALYYNADLLAADGVDPAALNSLRWSPDDALDTLRPLLIRLAGDRTRRWAYNAANDLQGIYLNYIGSAGGVFSAGDRFAFDNPQAAEAFRYLVRLINTDRVAPPASDTNDNGDFSRNMFLQGRMALFQSGTYNLAAVAANAAFR
ncbi:MAG: extracellular solute-binding protein, partial [Mycobacteriaceae bacterium]|nr:extracellular solute-binding protein [Mycobacteriaceae bacterium]